MTATKLAEKIMEEYFDQLMEDDMRITELMLAGSKDIQDKLQEALYGYISSINTNLHIFQEKYQGQMDFDILYRKLLNVSRKQVKRVMEKYSIIIKEKK